MSGSATSTAWRVRQRLDRGLDDTFCDQTIERRGPTAVGAESESTHASASMRYASANLANQSVPMLTTLGSVTPNRRPHHRRHHGATELGVDFDGDLVGEAVLAELDRRVAGALELGVNKRCST